jgi:glycosyltransferase involved in cell wall biosynthesis
MVAVSVIVPVFQNAKTIAEAIRSVLNQTFKDFEIIVIDDGSTDGLNKQLIEFDGKIKLLRQQNLGPAAARNNGIRNSSGEFVAFLDADDIWFPGKLSKQMDLFRTNHRVEVVFGNVLFWDGSKFQGKTYFDLFKPQRGKVLFPLFASDYIPFLSVVIRKETLRKVGLFDESIRFVEDYELLLRIALDSEFDYEDKPIGAYRIGRDQISRSYIQGTEALLAMKEKFFLENKVALDSMPRKVLDKGLFNKYLKLALWHIRDGRSKEAKTILDYYVKFRGITILYLMFSFLCILPSPVRFAVIHLWQRLRRRPQFGMY